MSNLLQDVAVIGAGLGGCALALSLSASNIRVTLYESRSQVSDVIPSGVVLTPNGLKVLDQLGVLARIKDRCYVPTHRTFKNDRDETVRKDVTASVEAYGYANHRIWRSLLLEEMRDMLAERGVRIHYESKFNGITSEDPGDGVTFRINGTTHHASLLIGSDGIYSTIRNYLVPGVEPEYTGVVGILAHIKRASVAWPHPEYERNATIQGKPGAIFFIPEDPRADDIMVGLQVQYPRQSRENLEKLQADKDRLVSFYTKDYDEWGTTAKSIIDKVVENKQSCYIWPFMRMPKLERWFSETGRVILVGDGAHALPPSSGQGVNMALEDVYTLTMLLTSVTGIAARNGGSSCGIDDQTRQDTVTEALCYWQKIRQERVNEIFDFATNSTNVQRLPEAERRRLIAEGKAKSNGSGDMSWLYQPRLEEQVRAWIEDKSQGARSK